MKQEIFQRKQFTFYESFYNCIKKTLKKKSDKLAAYEALIQYALYGQIDDFENLSDTVSGLLEAIYPVLNTARRNAINAKQSGNPKQNDSDASCPATVFNTSKKEIEIEKEIEKEIKNEIETKTESKAAAACFERFWSAYPKKIGKEDAYKAFLQAKQPLDVLLKAIEQQRDSPQWVKDAGTYIPSPAKWLRGKRWTDQLPLADTSSPLGTLEIEAVNRIMENCTKPT